jgi:TusA-related sulfurtransferase
MIVVDARGLSCPEPVLLTRRAISQLSGSDAIEVWVETATARDNVVRAARSMDCAIEVEEHADHFRLIVRRAGR